MRYVDLVAYTQRAFNKYELSSYYFMISKIHNFTNISIVSLSPSKS